MGEWATRILGRLLDLLALDNPRGTAVGALGGSFALFVVYLCRPVIERQQIIDPFHVPEVLYICAGIFIANLTRAFRRSALPEHIEMQIQLIVLGVKTHRLSAETAGEMYRALVRNILAQHGAPTGVNGAGD